MMNFIKKEDVVWKKVPYLRQGETRNYDYVLELNEPLASWDVWDYWERERIESMRTHLTHEDVLFDIGTEQGWCNLVYAKMVGPQNMVLIEPTPEFWPNIKTVWQKNYPGIDPKATYEGFFSNVTNVRQAPDKFVSAIWPKASDGPLIDKNSYKYIHEHADSVDQVKLDDFVALTGIVPTALTMDTEGAELLILKGAEKTLRDHSLKVWVSEHYELQKRNFNIEENEIPDFMKSLGYTPEYLATDHEVHVFYSKK